MEKSEWTFWPIQYLSVPCSIDQARNFVFSHLSGMCNEHWLRVPILQDSNNHHIVVAISFPAQIDSQCCICIMVHTVICKSCVTSSSIATFSKGDA